MFHVHVYNGWSPSAKRLLRCSGSTGAFQQNKKALIFDLEWISEGCGVQQWGVSVSRARRLLLFNLSVAGFSTENILNEIHSSSILSFWPRFMLGRLQRPHWLQWRRNTFTNKMQPVRLLFWYIWIIQAYSIHGHWGPTGGRKERNWLTKLYILSFLALDCREAYHVGCLSRFLIWHEGVHLYRGHSKLFSICMEERRRVLWHRSWHEQILGQQVQLQVSLPIFNNGYETSNDIL